MKRNLIKVLLLTIVLLLTTACTTDNMENIKIIVTNYPNEYIINSLYGKHATVESIYPDGVTIEDYKISNKKKNEYSKSDLFVYNGTIEKERNLAISLLDKNPELKIIDTAYVLETDYSPEELWLDPSSLLMMAQNVRIGLQEYIPSTVLKKDIDERYEKLKVKLSELEAEYRINVDNAKRKEIIVSTSKLKYLEKFNFKVICLDNDAETKTISEARSLVDEGNVSYIYRFKGEDLSKNAKDLVDSSNIQEIALNKLDNLSDKDRDSNKDYLSIMNDNLELLKKELYQ